MWVHRRARPGHVLEDGVPVGVEGDGYAEALYQAPHQQEVVAGVLLLAEQGVCHDAGGVIDGQQQREGRTMVSKPPVMAAVHLHQHALAGHPLPAYTVPGRPAVAWAPQTGTRQYAPQCGPAGLYPLTLPEQLTQVSVIGFGVAGPGKAQHPGPCRLRRRVGCPASTMTVSKCGCSLLSVSRQDAPGVASAHSHQRGRLLQSHVLCQQAVEDL